MGTTAARHGYQIIENARRVLAIECVIALQAAELEGRRIITKNAS